MHTAWPTEYAFQQISDIAVDSRRLVRTSVAVLPELRGVLWFAGRCGASRQLPEEPQHFHLLLSGGKFSNCNSRHSQWCYLVYMLPLTSAPSCLP